MSVILDPFAELIAWFLTAYYGLTHNYALAIVMVTVTVMVAIVPFNVKMTRSMLAQARWAPDIKALQEEHKDDRTKLNEEVMKFYKEKGINPLGCLIPYVLQAPFLFGMFRGLQGLESPVPKFVNQGTELFNSLCGNNGEILSGVTRTSGDKVTTIDACVNATQTVDGVLVFKPIQMKAIGIDLAEAVFKQPTRTAGIISVGLLLCYLAAQYIQQWQITHRSPPNPNPTMAKVQKFMPLVITLAFLGFMMGLVLYWLASAIFRIGQQAAMYRFDPVVVELVVARNASAKVTAAKASSKQGISKPNKRKASAPSTKGVGGGKARGPERDTKPAAKNDTAKSAAAKSPKGAPKGDGPKNSTKNGGSKNGPQGAVVNPEVSEPQPTGAANQRAKKRKS